jgi:hypothetical protein
MKQTLNVTANLNEPGLLRTVVETLASRHVDQGYDKSVVPQQWKAIETSCIQAYVLGSFDMKTNDNNACEEINVPFASCFLFTCFKAKYGLFNLEWSSSLS